MSSITASRGAYSIAGPAAAPRRRASTLSEIERGELRILERGDDPEDERTNPWFPPTGPEPARR